jgi:TatD DNase family protein
MDPQPAWFDNHCHLTTDRRPPSEVVAEAADAGVVKLLTVGCTVDDSRRAIEIAREFENVFATAGVHPHDASDTIAGLVELLDDPANRETVVAVGECGLDYHYDHSPREIQRQVFAEQIELAKERDLALVIHTREAWDDTFAILDEVGIPSRAVFHCFTGGPAEAESCLGRGAYLSFSGIVTFPSATDLAAAARITPLDRLLVETDSPFLTPVPHRGQPNRPAFVPLVGKKLADLREISAAEIAHVTWANGIDLYGA